MSSGGFIMMGIGGGDLGHFLTFGLAIGAPDEVIIEAAIGKKKRKRIPMRTPISQAEREREWRQQLALAAERLAKNKAEVQAATEQITVDAELKRTKQRIAKLLEAERSKSRKH